MENQTIKMKVLSRKYEKNMLNKRFLTVKNSFL